jgi:hypothetical protein
MVFGGSDAGLSDDTDQTFLCEIGLDYCKVFDEEHLGRWIE